MKSRLFVVNQASLYNTITNNEVSIIVPQLNGAEWEKTVADIMADMLQIEIGDYIFLWETRSASSKSKIHGVYRAISKPFYYCNSSNDNAPFKIKIEKAYDFDNPIEEYDFLNCPYIKGNLWTVIGKKVAGKSRGTSPLSIEESKYLITMLIGKNPNYKYYPLIKSNVVNVVSPLSINYSLNHNNSPTTIAALNPNNLSFFKSNYAIRYEKMLETIFNYEMTNKNQVFFNQLGINVDKTVWYSNYLPYSIEQSEMDYVIIQSEDGFTISDIYVLEFMIQPVDEDHIHRCLLYSKWVNETLTLGQCIVHPILICKSSVDFINGESSPSKINKLNKLKHLINNYLIDYNVNDIKIFEYKFNGSIPSFIRKK